MKYAILLAAFLLVGCSQQKDSEVTVGQPVTLTARAPAKTFTAKQMEGKWMVNVAFDPRITPDKRNQILKMIGEVRLDLNPDMTFTLTNPNGNYQGTWTLQDQFILMLVSKRGNKTISQIKEEMKKKHATPAQLAAVDQPAKLAISDDGMQLSSPTKNSAVLMTFKKVIQPKK